MRIAFISDIHGHLQALQAVLADIKSNNVQSIICLGDVISLGIQPREIITLLQEIDCQFILGNHDQLLIDHSQLGMLCHFRRNVSSNYLCTQEDFRSTS